RQDVAEACLLRDHGTSARQVARAAIAEPAAAQADVLVLGHGDLAERTADVAAVRVQGSREVQCVDDLPSVALEQGAVVGGEAAEAQLEGLAGDRWQVEELRELDVLAPGVDLPFVLDVAVTLAPVADRREPVSAASLERF